MTERMNDGMREEHDERLPEALPPSAIPGLYAEASGWRHDLWVWLFDRHAHSVVLEWANVQAGMDVLEVGVGTGHVLSEIAARNRQGRTIGVDLTPEMLAKARARLDHRGLSANLHEADARDLPFADGSFDRILCTFLLDLLPQRDFLPVLREFFRLLRPGGQLLLAEAAPPQHPLEHLWSWFYRLSPRMMGGCRGIRLGPYLEKAGFDIEKQQRVVRLSFPSEITLAKRSDDGT